MATTAPAAASPCAAEDSLERRVRALSAPREVRALIRDGAWRGLTAGLVEGFAQANLVVLPRELAYDFLLFCQRNPRPCPLLDVTDPGSPIPAFAAPDADLRTDVPRYHVYRDGQLVDTPFDLTAYWNNSMVGFLLGCSFTFEHELIRAGIRMQHIERCCNVAMYRTSVACRPAGIFAGPLVVSMRPIPASRVSDAVSISARFPAVHGAPVHVGRPEALGIKDLSRPDWGDAPEFGADDVPVFWACGVTPQAVAL